MTDSGAENALGTKGLDRLTGMEYNRRFQQPRLKIAGAFLRGFYHATDNRNR